MGTCWPKLKSKATRNNESNKNNFINLSKTTTKNLNHNNNHNNHNKKINKNLKLNNENSNNNQLNINNSQNNNITILQEIDNNNKQLQPRRDIDTNLDLNQLSLLPPTQPPVATAPTPTSTSTSPSTTQNNFKQFCKNSADKLTHKLSFTKSRNQNQQIIDNDNNIINTNMINETKILNLFDKYKDNIEKNSILANGIQEFCDDLNLKPDDFKILLLAWKLNAKQMCKFTKDEFINGFKNNLKVDNIKDLKIKLDYLEEDVKINQNEFKNLYRWSFDFGLDSEIGERVIPIEMAILLWELVYINKEPPILKKWLQFLKDNNNIKGIPRDTWYMFPLFCKSIGEFNYHLYDDNEAWPCLFDDFVQYETAIKTTNDIKLDVNNNNNNYNENVC